MNIAEILELKYPTASCVEDYTVRDDGAGLYIDKWSDSLGPKPTKKDLKAWATELDLKYRQMIEVKKRDYPPIGEQLDMIYKDSLNNTTIWRDTITAVKAAHPKPLV